MESLSPWLEYNTRVDLGGRGARQIQLHMGVLKLVIETGGHPGLDLRYPKLVHSVDLLHVEHVYFMRFSVDRFERPHPFPCPGVPIFRNVSSAVGLRVKNEAAALVVCDYRDRIPEGRERKTNELRYIRVWLLSCSS